MKPGPIVALLAALLLAQARALPGAQSLPQFDFTRADTAREWGSPHDISALQPTSTGLEITIGGDDPYFFGPARDYPPDTPLWLSVRLKSDQAGTCEIFYFQGHVDPQRSVRFSARAGQWTEARLRLPALGTNYKLRIDPPGTSGRVLLENLRIEERVVVPPPSWPPWTAVAPATERVLAAEPLEFFQATNTPFGFELRVGGRSMAVGHPSPRVGYLQGDDLRWIEFSTVSVEKQPDARLVLSARSRDADGALWTYEQAFRVSSPRTIAAETTVTVDKNRTVMFLPMHLLIAGEGSFGRTKGQGLFAGLEYLENEPSSSEADIIGPESKRQVPALHKITFPLMAIQASNRWVGLIWEDARSFGALFDSPDRIFGSSGHVMGVIFPGSDGQNREEGNLLPEAGQLLRANQSLTTRAWFVGGIGQSIVPAVQHYVQLRGLPPLPETGLSFHDYVALAGAGWLSSKCRETNFYKHAVWPGFHPQPAADAAMFETWLAGHTADRGRSNALLTAAQEAISAVQPHNYYHSVIGHIRTPAAPLVFGAVPAATRAARDLAKAQLARFETDGSVLYRPSRGGTDYAKTHFAREANGLTAQAVLTLLEAAAFSGDHKLIADGIAKLRALDKFRDTVPRGAQTWEVPLHTPDILAAAHLVRVYTLGYELSGEREFLQQAIYWAWSGVPFVYLVNPVGERVGPYSTIAVFGATSWKAPVWFGRPVQWCGMVYADALYRLCDHDRAGPWKKLADGITSAALQHTWRADDRERVGLLPDFYELREQAGAGPAINPATVGMAAARLFGQGPLYDFHAFRRAGLFVHAPGEIIPEAESNDGVKFTVRTWPSDPCFVLVTGFTNAPRVLVNGTARTHEFNRPEGALILKLSGLAHVEIASMTSSSGQSTKTSSRATRGNSTAQLRLGIFDADVTVPSGHGMMGGAWLSKTVTDPLEAHGFVILGDGLPVVFVSVDWCEIRNDAYDRWQAALADAAGTVPERVLITTVHQHDAPIADLEAERLLRSRRLEGTICDPDFHEVAVQRVATALRKGISAARPLSHIGTGEAKVERIGSNRRYVTDGTVRFDRTSSTRHAPAIAADEGLIDPFLKTLSFWDGSNALAAVSFYAVHPMSYYGAGEVSADFPGLARRKRQSETPGIKQIYCSGCSGNVTAGKYNNGAKENRAVLASRLYAAMAAAMTNTVRHSITNFDFRVIPLRFEPRSDAGFSVAELEARLIPGVKPFEQCLAAMGLSWRKRVDAGHEIQLPVLDFGFAHILLLPGESYVEFQLAAQRFRPDSFVCVAGYGEAACGYVPTEKHIAERDTNLSDWCWVAPGSEARLLEALRRALDVPPGAR